VDSSVVARLPVLRLSQEEATTPLAGHDAPQPSTEVSDENLIAAICVGSREALALLFARYAKLVRHIGRRILRDDAEADDFVQDLFLFLQRKSSIFDSSKAAAASWIVHMTYQRAIEQRRRLATRQFYRREDLQSSASQMVGNPTIDQDYSPEVVFGRNGLQKIVGVLSDDQRETLRLYFFEGYTLAEIGTRLGQPLGNIRHHYYRALDKLRQQMFGRRARGG
jgi:RNA polymerase sigma-70 factor, ECF subfamily